MFSKFKLNFSKLKFAALSMLMMFIVNIMPANFVQASDFFNTNFLQNQFSDENEVVPNIDEDSALQQKTSIIETAKSPTSFEEVAYYIKRYKKLPNNFITKKQAISLGWVASKGNLAEVAPGKSIGGDVFTYSNDGLFYKTIDHYKTFKKMNV